MLDIEMKKPAIRATIAAALAAAMAFGCVSESELRSRRIYDNIQAFSQLDQAAQERIRGGTVTIGDGTAAAWMALGEPSSKTVQVTAEGTVEVWNYTRTTVEYYDVLVQTDPWMLDPPPPPPPPGYHRRHCHHPPMMDWHYEERSRLVEVPRMQLVFSNGVCTSVTTY